MTYLDLSRNQGWMQSGTGRVDRHQLCPYTATIAPAYSPSPAVEQSVAVPVAYPIQKQWTDSM